MPARSLNGLTLAITMCESGHIVLDGDVIRYRSAVYGDWDLPLADVRIVGEATNESGPFADDYFFCFATGPEMWVEASFYAAGRDVFLRTLGARLRTLLTPGLCHSTDFASRVLWPPSLAGEAMFRYEDIPPKGLPRKVLGPTHNRQTYAERVAAVLAGDGQPNGDWTGRQKG